MRQEDVLVQWVPLFHDMGLFALLAAIAVGGDAHLFTPCGFLRKPLRVLQHMARVHATIFTGPNFGYDHLLAALDAEGIDDGYRLDSWRIAFNGGETVRPGTVEAFACMLGPLGVAPQVMTPAYGMAEATLEIACKRLGQAPVIGCFDRTALSNSPGRAVSISPHAPQAVRLVSSGTPVPGMNLRITSQNGIPAEHGVVGEIEISGAAVTNGYRNDPLATAAVFCQDDGWLRTGDLGFVHDGELYLTGRLRTMVVLRGRNFFAEDVEAVAQDVEGVHRRCCVAFADQAAEQIVIMVEARGAPEDPALAQRIRAEVATRLDLREVRVILVPPGQLPRTTSGKWQRDKAARMGLGPADQHTSENTKEMTS